MDTQKRVILPNITEILHEFFSESGYPKEIIEVTEKMFHHLMPDHLHTSVPFLFPKFCKILKPHATEELLEMASSLGWIHQMLHSYYIGIDDFLDDGEERSGRSTWSKIYNHEKTVIIPDLSILRSVAFFATQKTFSHLPPVYFQLLQLILDADTLFSKGIRLEKHLSIADIQEGKIKLETINMESYNLIFRSQLSPFFYLPLALVMTMADYTMEKDRDLFRSLEIICDDFATLIKVADDYNEIFSQSSYHESSDSDIRKGQFTWLFLMAKESCVSEDQIRDLLNHYGKDNDESVVYVKELLEKNGIHDLYKNYRKELIESIAKQLNSSFPKNKEVVEMFQVYFNFWKKWLGID